MEKRASPETLREGQLKDDQTGGSASHRDGAPPSVAATHRSVAQSPHDLDPSVEPQRCPVCRCNLVYPTDWRRVGSAAWRLVLYCPNCAMQRAVSLGREEMQRFNVALYEASELLADQTEQLAQQRLEHTEECIRSFVAALDADLILPTDF